MKLHTVKKLDYGFVILCSDHNPKLASNTVKSLKKNYADAPYICVTDKAAKRQDLEELKQVATTYKAKNTFSSLINVGLKHAPAEWNFIIISGSWVRPHLNFKFSKFIDSEKDILFPIANNITNFVDATLNGLFFHKKVLTDIGAWPEDEEMDNSKLLWAINAINKQYKFKAIAGSKIC